MEPLKYIRGRIGFAIFDAGQEHAKIAATMSSLPESAGFCTIAVGYRNGAVDNEEEGKGTGEEERFVSVHCFGQSVTLGLHSAEDDGEYLERQINGLSY